MQKPEKDPEAAQKRAATHAKHTAKDLGREIGPEEIGGTLLRAMTPEAQVLMDKRLGLPGQR